MSDENVEITRRAFQRWVDGGGTLDAIPVEVYAEDVEWDLSAYPLVDLPSRGRGRDNVFRVFAQYLSGWTNYRPEAREFIDAGDGVIVVLHEAAGLRDGGSLDHLWGYVCRAEDGRLSYFRAYLDPDEALEAAGLTE